MQGTILDTEDLPIYLGSFYPHYRRYKSVTAGVGDFVRHMSSVKSAGLYLAEGLVYQAKKGLTK